MKSLIGVVEDQPETRIEIAKALSGIADSKVIEAAKPWNFLDKLEEMHLTEMPDKRLLVADLYIPGYWSQSPKNPCVTKARPVTAATQRNPESYKNAVLDSIRNYLKPIVEEHKFTLIVYSHIFVFLADFPKGEEMVREIKNELSKLRVSEDDIIRKERKESSRRSEMSALVTKIEELTKLEVKPNSSKEGSPHRGT